MTDKQFVNGLIVKPPHENAPDFVKCKLSIKRAELAQWLTTMPDEWINLQVKVGKSGKWYAEVDTWKPQGQDSPQTTQPQTTDAFDDDIPF